MSKITAPRGTADTLPADSWKWQAVEAIARQVAGIYHFCEIRTPIFESTELFHRGVGETSDVVHKETYTFMDRGDRSMTLRPEQTAGVVRAAIEHGLIAQEGARAKIFYIGPNFRYERPASGRLRQHHQFGVEAFGIAEPEQDVECMLLQLDFYRRCGVKDMKLRVNSLGDKASKQKFAQHIQESLEPQKQSLSEDSQRRLVDNPLRILDSKDPRDHGLTNNLVGLQFLSDRSKAHLDRVRELLDKSGIEYSVDGKLVRGFDYYTDTLWEVTAAGLGAQDALGGGGRYDNLVETLGGRATPGVGFGSGLERLLIALESQQVSLPNPRRLLVWLAAHGPAAREASWRLLSDLRQAGIAADMDLSDRSLKAQFKIADREAANFCIVTGDNELAAAQVMLKDLSTGQQSSVPRAQIIAHLVKMMP